MLTGFIIRILTYMNRTIVKNGLLLIFVCLLQISNVYAQNRLSLEEAVQTALENNYDIKLNKNEVEIGSEFMKGAGYNFNSCTGKVLDSNNIIHNTIGPYVLINENSTTVKIDRYE